MVEEKEKHFYSRDVKSWRSCVNRDWALSMPWVEARVRAMPADERMADRCWGKNRVLILMSIKLGMCTVSHRSLLPGPSLTQSSLRRSGRARRWNSHETSPQAAPRTATTLPHPATHRRKLNQKKPEDVWALEQDFNKRPRQTKLGIGRKHWITRALATWGNVPGHKYFYS